MSVGKRAENGKGQYHLYAIVTHDQAFDWRGSNVENRAEMASDTA